MNDDLLGKLLNFTDADLKANRTGNLTEKQRKHLEWEVNKSRILLGLLVFGYLILIYDLVTTVMQNQPITTAMIRNTVGFGIVWSFFGYNFYQKMRYHQKILASNTVESIDGVLWRSEERVFLSSTLHYVGIADKKFRVKTKIYNAFAEDEQYTLYFTNDTILSVE